MCRPCGRRQSPHPYYLFILPILLLLIINLFVLVCICFQKRRETFARPCPITPQEEGMLPIPSPSALHNARCNQNTGKTRQCSIVATASHVRPFTSTFMAPFYQPQCILLLRLPLVPRHICVLPMEVRIR